MSKRDKRTTVSSLIRIQFHGAAMMLTRVVVVSPSIKGLSCPLGNREDISRRQGMVLIRTLRITFENTKARMR